MLLGIAGQAWEAEYSGVNQKKLVKTLSRPQKLEVLVPPKVRWRLAHHPHTRRSQRARIHRRISLVCFAKSVIHLEVTSIHSLNPNPKPYCDALIGHNYSLSKP